MNRFSILSGLFLLGLVQLNHSYAQARPDLRYCGSTGTTGSNLYLGSGPYNEITNSCTPDNNTQALLVTRSGTISGNGAAWLAYLDAGGIIITEYRNSHSVYNEIYGTNYNRPVSRDGDCEDNTMPSEILNPADPFWINNNSLTPTPPTEEACGYDLSAIVNGEPAVTALGGWLNTSSVMFAYRPQGAGHLWLLDADWQDGEVASYTDDSRNFFGALLNGGFGADGPQGRLDPREIPVLSIPGIVLFGLGLAFLARRKIATT